MGRIRGAGFFRLSADFNKWLYRYLQANAPSIYGVNNKQKTKAKEDVSAKSIQRILKENKAKWDDILYVMSDGDIMRQNEFMKMEIASFWAFYERFKERKEKEYENLKESKRYGKR